MANLTPVDFDPFAEAGDSGPTLTAVDYEPEFTEVDFDPFADEQPEGDLTWEDHGRSIMAGGAQVGAGMGWLAERAGQATGWEGLENAGSTLEQVSNDAADTWREGLSDYAGQVEHQQFLKEDPDSWSGYEWGDAGFDKVKLMLSQSLLGTAAGMGAGAGITKGISVLPGVSRGVAATLGYSSGEALVAAPAAGAQAEQEVRAMQPAELNGHVEYQALLLEGKSETEAMEILALAAGGQAAATTAISTAILSSPFGKILDDVMGGNAGGMVSGLLKGGATEAAQEAVQSGAEQLSVNAALLMNADADRSLLQDVPEAVVGGAAAGAAMGGAFGVAGGVGAEREQRQQADLDQQAEEAAEAARIRGGDALDEEIARQQVYMDGESVEMPTESFNAPEKPTGPDVPIQYNPFKQSMEPINIGNPMAEDGFAQDDMLPYAAPDKPGLELAPLDASPRQQVERGLQLLNDLNPQLGGVLRAEFLSDAELQNRPTNEPKGMEGLGRVRGGRNGAVINLPANPTIEAVAEELRHMVDMLIGNGAISQWIEDDAGVRESVTNFLDAQKDAGDLAPHTRYTDGKEIAQSLLDQYFRNPEAFKAALPDMFTFIQQSGGDKYRGVLAEIQGETAQAAEPGIDFTQPADKAAGVEKAMEEYQQKKELDSYEEILQGPEPETLAPDAELGESGPSGREQQVSAARKRLEAQYTDAEKVAVAKVPTSAKQDMQVMELQQYIVRNGTLDAQEAIDQGIDPEMVSTLKVNGRKVFKEGGKSFEHMAEAANEDGFFSAGQEVGPNSLLDLIGKSSSGQEVYTPKGAEGQASREAASHQMDEIQQRIDKLNSHVDEDNDTPPLHADYTGVEADVQELSYTHVEAELAGVEEHIIDYLLDAGLSASETNAALKEQIQRAKQPRQAQPQGESEGGIQGDHAPSRGQGSEAEGEGQEQRGADQGTGDSRPVDLFGAAPVDEQALHDAQLETEAKLSGGDVPADIDDGLFAQEFRRNQTDLDSEAKAKAQFAASEAEAEERSKRTIENINDISTPTIFQNASGTLFYTVTPPANGDNKYQVTVWDKDGPVSDSKHDTPEGIDRHYRGEFKANATEEEFAALTSGDNSGFNLEIQDQDNTKESDLIDYTPAEDRASEWARMDGLLADKTALQLGKMLVVAGVDITGLSNEGMIQRIKMLNDAMKEMTQYESVQQWQEALGGDFDRKERIEAWANLVDPIKGNRHRSSMGTVYTTSDVAAKLTYDGKNKLPARTDAEQTAQDQHEAAGHAKFESEQAALEAAQAKVAAYLTPGRGKEVSDWWDGENANQRERFLAVLGFGSDKRTKLWLKRKFHDTEVDGKTKRGVPNEVKLYAEQYLSTFWDEFKADPLAFDNNHTMPTELPSLAPNTEQLQKIAEAAEKGVLVNELGQSNWIGATRAFEHQLDDDYGPGKAGPEIMAFIKSAPEGATALETSVRPNGKKWHRLYLSFGGGQYGSESIGSGESLSLEAAEKAIRSHQVRQDTRNAVARGKNDADAKRNQDIASKQGYAAGVQLGTIIPNTGKQLRNSVISKDHGNGTFDVEGTAGSKRAVIKVLPAEAIKRAADRYAGNSVEVLDEAAQEAATSPENDYAEPTDAQKEAGNYKKGHIKLFGLNITIENPKGSTRSGTDPSGEEWSNTMGSHYGYIKGTEGADGDHVDVFIGEELDAASVYVVDQFNQDGSFDEHKAMLGFGSEWEAEQGYLDEYHNGWDLGPVTEMPVEEFKAWVEGGDTKSPLSEPSKKTDKEPINDGLGHAQQPEKDEVRQMSKRLEVLDDLLGCLAG